MGEVPQATVEAGGVFKCSVVGEDRDGSMFDMSQEEIDRLDKETRGRSERQATTFTSLYRIPKQ